MSSMDKDQLGNRMKSYEAVEAQRRFMPLIPVMARIDGRAFHSFTRGMERPFDEAFSRSMIETTYALVKETNACLGYTQSDEISLVWHQTDRKSQLWFDGRIQKMCSQLAALATLYFYRAIQMRSQEYADRMPTFDARVWQVPNRTEGANTILWREIDAVKNSISMAAANSFSPKQLLGKTQNERLDMLHSINVNWNDYPDHFKRGTYVQRQVRKTPFTADEIANLPPKHAARSNPDLIIERSVVTTRQLPPMLKITNREEVVFDGAEPMVIEPVVIEPVVNEELFVVRLFDGFDHEWMDVSEPVSKVEADRILSEKTKAGTKNTTFNDIDYYRIFPADTKMIFSSHD